MMRSSSGLCDSDHRHRETDRYIDRHTDRLTVRQTSSPVSAMFPPTDTHTHTLVFTQCDWDAVWNHTTVHYINLLLTLTLTCTPVHTSQRLFVCLQLRCHHSNEHRLQSFSLLPVTRHVMLTDHDMDNYHISDNSLTPQYENDG